MWAISSSYDSKKDQELSEKREFPGYLKITRLLDGYLIRSFTYFKVFSLFEFFYITRVLSYFRDDILCDGYLSSMNTIKITDSDDVELSELQNFLSKSLDSKEKSKDIGEDGFHISIDANKYNPLAYSSGKSDILVLAIL